MKNIFENNDETPIVMEGDYLDDPETKFVVVECAGHSYDGDGICRICGTIDVFRQLGHITSLVQDDLGITIQGTLTEAGEYFMKVVDDEIFGLKVGEVHPPEPQTGPIGYVECDECGAHHVVHAIDRFGLIYCTCGGYFHWFPKEV